MKNSWTALFSLSLVVSMLSLEKAFCEESSLQDFPAKKEFLEVSNLREEESAQKWYAIVHGEVEVVFPSVGAALRNYGSSWIGFEGSVSVFPFPILD